MDACRWDNDDICCNARCPYCSGSCPVKEYPDICVYAEEEDKP